MKNGFRGERAVLQREITIHATPGAIFPLLCPVREGEWLDGWIGKPVYASSGVTEENGVFATEHLGQEDTIWFVLRHDPATWQVEFLYLVPRLQVVRLYVQVTPIDAGTSRIGVKYIRTGISDDGNELIRYADEIFDTMMNEWVSSMNHFFATGTVLEVYA